MHTFSQKCIYNHEIMKQASEFQSDPSSNPCKKNKMLNSLISFYTTSSVVFRCVICVVPFMKTCVWWEGKVTMLYTNLFWCQVRSDDWNSLFFLSILYFKLYIIYFLSITFVCIHTSYLYTYILRWVTLSIAQRFSK